jgi:hypothetical protein
MVDRGRQTGTRQTPVIPLRSLRLRALPVRLSSSLLGCATRILAASLLKSRLGLARLCKEAGNLTPVKAAPGHCAHDSHYSTASA